MNLAIVYDSRTGTTKAMAEAMAAAAREGGHHCDLFPVQSADAAQVSGADAICIGSWTEGLFFIMQHATKATMQFIDDLTLHGQPVAVFCTYKTSPGKMLAKMSAAIEAGGGKVTGQFKARGSAVPADFADWLRSSTPR